VSSPVDPWPPLPKSIALPLSSALINFNHKET
jgi:hypothetical protein